MSSVQGTQRWRSQLAAMTSDVSLGELAVIVAGIIGLIIGALLLS